MRISRRLFLIPLFILLLAAVIGLAVETLYQQRDKILPPPGALVAVNGGRMHLLCLGQSKGDGQPTVILEAGLGGSSLDWGLVQERLAGSIRVCSYDRPGYGWSDPSPLPRTPQQVTSDLHVMLQSAGEAGPFLLVAHSVGGLYAHRYASDYAAEVAGLVLVDPRSIYSDRARSSAEQRWSEMLSTLMLRGTRLAGRFGLVRLFGSRFLAIHDFPPDQQDRIIRLVYQPVTVDTALREIAGARDFASTGHVKEALGDIPLVVLTAGQAANDARWSASHRRLAGLSSNGRLVVAEGCGHYIHWQNPGLVVENILALIAR